MIEIHSADIVAAALAAAGACLALAIPREFVRRFPGWALTYYGRRVLLLPLLAMTVGTWLLRLGVAGQLDTSAGHAMVIAAAFLTLLLVSALLRFYLSDYRKR